ncbi:glycoside hydrolase family 16 protein [Patellaria atrata CBS 101060]|uniref:endo-1,3(4)-beta-glucanase n=1 Tax=Patellaria atrata CBS 101060 TaxID=1346257 RepID=A0A9P4S9J4_9PEZI|nr:glycoside hydrolase family 16 protein [Patellaria atrata CBS 101060]
MAHQSTLIVSIQCLLLALFFSPALAQIKYTISDTYRGTSFFNNFNFFTAADPTHGYVHSTSAIIRADSKTVLTTSAVGRKSVRIESKKTWTYGLFIADIKHMPGNACGVWPAFWTLGSGTWPTNGEIDIIEGVNRQTANQIVLHTSNNCKVVGQKQTGTLADPDCSVSHSTAGCATTVAGANAAKSFGNGFNSNNGGIYAMEWTSAGIKIWFFPRGGVPASITQGAPTPERWGTPTAHIPSTGCSSSHFKQHKLIVNTVFCGDWAGNVYGTSGCPMYSGKNGYDSCKEYVRRTPSAFTQAYWEINYIKVFRGYPGALGVGNLEILAAGAGFCVNNE